jgi:flagellar biogenesis protein FliO
VSSLSGYLKESVAILLVVVVLAAFLLYAARRAGVGRAMGPIELLARLPLEPRRSVYVVRVLDRVLIIGSSEAGLAKLGQLARGAAAEFRGAPPVADLKGALATAWSASRRVVGRAPRAEAASSVAAAAEAPNHTPRPETPGDTA